MNYKHDNYFKMGYQWLKTLWGEVYPYATKTHLIFKYWVFNFLFCSKKVNLGINTDEFRSNKAKQ